MKKNITFLDVTITLVLMSLIIAVLTYNMAAGKGKNSVLIIESPKERFYYNLNQKKILNINGALGVTRIEINNGRFRFIESACINKICINTGWISINNIPVICLPNRVSAYIKNEASRETVDGISR
jgi:hypothetical protein